MRRAAIALTVVTALLGLLTALTQGMLLVRAERLGHPGFDFLTWNLFLAWIPFGLALGLAGLHAARRGPAWLLPVGALWLLFLPNAPYLLTDYIHLGALPGAPLWFDALLIGSFAGTGLLLFATSLLVVHGIVEARLGRAAGWSLSVATVVLSAIGVYVGRFLRWNSWDVFTDPHSLVGTVLGRLTDPLGNPFLLAFAAGLTVLLLVSYGLVWALGRGLLGSSQRQVMPG